MIKLIIKILLLPCVIAHGGGLFAAALASEEDSTLRSIYLVRHAEKQTGKDPQLTQKGLERAQFYSRYFQHLDIDTVFASRYRRNQETVAPIAQALDLTAKAFDPSKHPEFAKQLLRTKGDVLVVAHNNLTEIIRALGGDVEGNIDHSEYRHIYQLLIHNNQLIKTQLFIGPNL